MEITIRYEAQARRARGLAEETIALAGPCRVTDCIRQIAESHEESLRPMLLDAAGDVQPALLVFVGEEHVRRDSDRQIADGETITLMPPISGG